ncbi:hypothetical protein G5714_005019 [Onychostoma macrolepis]|uniref:C2 domain-containing protein n=1 Tax=Onychostoma macrolepis TaxID=369639 RepID=A0A7J6D6B1_9TELE|nr:hypothetical protein G5714_005019 [Onychostoma macrolepis]
MSSIPLIFCLPRKSRVTPDLDVWIRIVPSRITGEVWCGSTFGGQTEYHKDTANPTWSAEFNFPNCRCNETLKLEVWDKDMTYDDLLGTCTKLVQYGSFTVTCYLNKGTVFYRFDAK